MIDREGTISNYYELADADDSLRPFDNVLRGYHVDFDMIAQILVDNTACLRNVWQIVLKM